MNIKGLFTPKIGDEVIVLSNNTGQHYYQIGTRYKITADNGISYLLDGIDAPFHGNRNWISSNEFEIADLNRDQLIDELSSNL